MIRRSRRGRARLGKRKKKVFTVKALLTLVISISFIAVSTWLVRLPQINIDTVEISGNAITTSESLREIIDTELDGTYMFLVPRSNIFLYPRRSISLLLTEQFPRIKRVSVSFADFHTITVEVKERVPFGLWCGATDKLTAKEGSKCFYLDNRGYIFAQSPNFSGDIFFRYYGPLHDTFIVTDPLRMQYLPAAQFLGYNLFLEALRDLKINPVALVRDEDSDLHLKFESGAVLLFRTDQNLNTILENFRSILLSSIFLEQGIKNVEYIDLRYGNKVFYKTK